MSRLGILILLVALAVPLAVSVLSHGRFILVGLPLIFGVPLAGWFGRPRR